MTTSREDHGQLQSVCHCKPVLVLLLSVFKVLWRPGMVAHAFNSVLRRQRQVEFCEYEASLVYITSFRAAKTT